MDDEIIAEVRASAPRRGLAMILLVSLGILLVWLAASGGAELIWRVFLLALGNGALWLAVRLWQASERKLVLTRTVLRDDAGTVLLRVEDVVRVDRGAFAFKPSNGFVVHLRDKAEGAWKPGLWWRFGKRVAIGGVTPGSQTKPMADILATLIALPKTP